MKAMFLFGALTLVPAAWGVWQFAGSCCDCGTCASDCSPAACTCDDCGCSCGSACCREAGASADAACGTSCCKG